MSYYFGDWIREQRELAGLTQKELAEKTQNKIKQNTISMWERKDIAIPSIQNILIITDALGLSLRSVPFDHFNLEVKKTSNKNKGRERIKVKERFGLYDLPSASSVRTFDGKTYQLKGFIGVETKTGEVKHITDLYYNVRSVVKDSKFLAKRKNENEELIRVKGLKKIK